MLHKMLDTEGGAGHLGVAIADSGDVLPLDKAAFPRTLTAVLCAFKFRRSRPSWAEKATYAVQIVPEHRVGCAPIGKSSGSPAVLDFSATCPEVELDALGRSGVA